MARKLQPRVGAARGHVIAHPLLGAGRIAEVASHTSAPIHARSLLPCDIDRTGASVLRDDGVGIDFLDFDFDGACALFGDGFHGSSWLNFVIGDQWEVHHGELAVVLTGRLVVDARRIDYIVESA